MTVSPSASPELPPPPPLAGAAVAAVVVLSLAGWVALGSQFLSETSLFGGFLVLWYWAKVEKLSMQRMPATVLGGLVGILVAWAMFYGASNYGGTGLALGLLLLIFAIYLDVIQVLPTFFNASTMLFSIIAAAPLVQLKVDWVELCLAVAVGGGYFAAFVGAVMWLAGKAGQKSS
jgi:hypothetical protein